MFTFLNIRMVTKRKKNYQFITAVELYILQPNGTF